MTAMNFSPTVASISSFTPRGMYQPHRASSPFLLSQNINFTVPLQDWYSLRPQLPLSVSSARPAPRPRPRYLQATAAAAAAGPRQSATSSSLSGQYSFFFGGIALQTYPLASPTADPFVEPALLSDLWMVDVLANTTTLLHGDPALVRLPAGLGATGSPTVGVYASTLRPAARHSASLAYDPTTRILWLFGGAYYPIIAGNADKQAFFDDMWSFSLDRRQWAWWSGSTEAKTRPVTNFTITTNPSPTAGAAIAAYGGQIVIYGGTL